MLEGADAEGERNEAVLRGDARAVRQRRERAHENSRARLAVQAELDRIQDLEVAAPVPAETLRKEREAVAERGRIVQKTAAKVATDEHTWQLFVEEQDIEVDDDHPSVETCVEFAVWMTQHRERACLAQRVEAGARLTGKTRTTIRNMLTELFTHVWPRRWASYAALDKKERATYEDAILRQVDGLHKKAVAAPADAEADAGLDEEACERAAQLTAQTAPVTQRKHFYRTEVHQVRGTRTCTRTRWRWRV